MSIIAKSISEAAQASGEIRAGGTDLMERRRHRVSTGDVVDIARLPDLDAIDPRNDGCTIGALATIHETATHPDLIRFYPGLAMAAGALATPQIRVAASMGGALLQRTRCWYFRHEGFQCFKKGGKKCFSREGNHSFGVCFDIGPCAFPHPSTLGMVLMAYDAQVDIYEQESRPIAALYGKGTDPSRDHLLQPGEILTHIQLPAPLPGEKAAYFRSISRARAEWPLVEAVVRYQLKGGVMQNVRVAIGGVAPIPLTLPKVDAFLTGKKPDEFVWEEAGELAAEGANPLPMTGYKVELVKSTVFETLRRADAGIWGGEG